MKAALGYLGTFLLGVMGTVAIIVFLIFVANKASAQSVPTHEAKPGEISRSLNYKSQGYTHGLTVLEVPATITIDYVSCSERNLTTYAYIKMIAKEITKHPELGHIYAGALTTLHSMWCTSDD